MYQALCRFVAAPVAALSLAAGLVVNTAPAHAASISYTDSSCASFAITGSAPNFTLTCSKLACSLAANPASPLTPLTASTSLTTTCAPSGTYTYTWSASTSNSSNCPPAPIASSNTATLTGSGKAASNCVYQVDVGGGASGNGVATVALEWTATAPPPVAAAPTGCSLAPNASSLPAGGGALVLTATCTGGGAPTSFDWTGGSIATTTTTGTLSTNITATTNFTVTPRNAGGAGNPASASVTVSPTVVGGGGYCNQYSNVIPTVQLTAGQAATYHSSDLGGFAFNGVWVFQLTIPAGIANSNSVGTFSVAEYQGLPTTRQLTVSTQPCDFRFPDYSGATGPFTWSNGTTATASHIVVGPSEVGHTGSLAGMLPGQTYYINVRNWSLDLSGVSCPAGSQCNAIFTYQPAK